MLAAPAQPAIPESGWLTQPVLLAAAGLLLAALAGTLVWQRKRQQKQALANESRPEPTGFGQAAGLSVDTAKTQGPVSSMMYSPSQLEASGEIDPIAEADVYLAYGRMQQAEEILRDALRTHPGQVSLHLKLLEIAVQRQDRDACMALMDQIATLTSRQGPDWSTASDLIARLRPDQPETDPAKLASSQTAPLVAPAVMAVAAASLESSPPKAGAAGPLKGLPILDLSLAADSVAQASEMPAAPEPATDPNSQAAPIELDFDLSLPSPEPAPAAASQPTVSQTELADNGMDFSLDLEEIGNASTAELAQSAASDPAPDRPAEPEMMLDFELESENKTDELADLVVSEDNSASDPLATQLELAQEFLALGDADGARSLAERVLARTTGDLQARARALLDRLDAARPQ